MTGSMISIDAFDGGSFQGYLALPSSGQGPGLVICQEIFGVNATMRGLADHFAEEGYVVLVPDLFWRQQAGIELDYTEAGYQRAFQLYQGFDEALGVRDIAQAVAALRGHPACDGKVGAIGYCLGGKLAFLAAARVPIDVAIGYYGVGIEAALSEVGSISCPLLLHIPALDKYCPPAAQQAITAALAGLPGAAVYIYPGVDHAFARPGGDHFNQAAAQIAYDRSLGLLRSVLGPHYDLGAIADHHFALEFAARDTDATMTTMVAQPYVNHVPTMTGGVGAVMLHRFYQNHFIHSNPSDMTMVPISRTIGVNRLVDEFVLCFTHDCEIDWLLPNVKPTGKKVEIPMLALVNFRGDKLYNEHIYWDQASVLVQVGLLDPKLVPAITGVEQARKLQDSSLPSNTLMARWADSAPK